VETAAGEWAKAEGSDFRVAVVVIRVAGAIRVAAEAIQEAVGIRAVAAIREAVGTPAVEDIRLGVVKGAIPTMIRAEAVCVR
jgi:hypothetical protein